VGSQRREGKERGGKEMGGKLGKGGEGEGVMEGSHPTFLNVASAHFTPFLLKFVNNVIKSQG